MRRISLLLSRIPAVEILAACLSCSSRLSACDARYEGKIGVSGFKGAGVATIMRLTSVLKGRVMGAVMCA